MEMEKYRIITILVLSCLIAVAASADLMVNGGAESGDLTGWSVDLSAADTANDSIIATIALQDQSGPDVTPHSGNYFFTFANERTSQEADAGITISMYQTGTSGLGSPRLTLEGYVQTEHYDGGNDDGEAILALYGDSGETSLLTSASTGVLDSHGAWSLFSLSVENPGDADHWKVTLLGTENKSTFTNVFYDDVSLVAVPTPAAVVMGILGLTAAGVKLRKYA